MKDFICKHCSRLHPLQYFLFENGARHLFYKCPESKQLFYLPYQAGLDIGSGLLSIVNNFSKIILAIPIW